MRKVERRHIEEVRISMTEMIAVKYSIGREHGLSTSSKSDEIILFEK